MGTEKTLSYTPTYTDHMTSRYFSPVRDLRGVTAEAIVMSLFESGYLPPDVAAEFARTIAVEPPRLIVRMGKHATTQVVEFPR